MPGYPCCCNQGVVATVCSEWRQFFDDRGWDLTQGDAQLTISGSADPTLDGVWSLPPVSTFSTNIKDYKFPTTGSHIVQVTLLCGIGGEGPNDWNITGTSPRISSFGPATQNLYFFPSNMTSIINSPVTLAPILEDPGAIWTVIFP